MLRLGSAAPFLQKALQPPKPDAVTMAIEKLTYLVIISLFFHKFSNFFSKGSFNIFSRVYTYILGGEGKFNCQLY